MAWWIMAISTFMALIALLLCYSNFTPAAASTFGFLDRLRASSISQRPIGAQNADAHELSSTAEEPWNVMQHQGGNSPWFQKTQGIIEGGIEPPAGCRIDQVHMVGGPLRTVGAVTDRCFPFCVDFKAR